MTQKSVVKSGRCFEGPIYVLGPCYDAHTPGLMSHLLWAASRVRYQGLQNLLSQEDAVIHCMSKAVSYGFICCNLLKIKDKRIMPFVTFKHCQEHLNINWNLITNHNNLCNLNPISLHLYFELIFSGYFALLMPSSLLVLNTSDTLQHK